MTYKIVQYTIKKLNQMRPFDSQDCDIQPTNLTELKALIGILYIAGLDSSGPVNVNDLQSND